MIKINLALRKHAVGLAGREKGAGFDLRVLSGGMNADMIKDPLVRKLGLVVVVAVMATYLLGGFKDDELKKADDVLTKVNEANAKLSVELTKAKGYENLKKQIDADETTLRTKLDTIKKLIADRTVPPKLMASLSAGIPSEVWLSEMSVDEKELKIKGYATGYAQITDFFKNLNENEFLTDVKLVDSKQTKDPVTGNDMASFELSARKK
jgi:Tfp pilus assembly protein PilN